ncbi:MAG TPA: efflux RND transporter periplasmic adaptor subunit [Usitatibacter sp.]|jgi:membrane fusion protein (multidrug efflux system)|nr:efflux RND transporter periplasmic adaptor subunit [Usitatibacter sp.]
MFVRTLKSARASALFASSVLLLAACGGGAGGHPGGPGAGGMPPIPVAVEEVKPHDVAVEFEYPAQTAGSREVEVRARVSGILLKRNYEEGAPVHAGQSLFSIDPATYEAAAARAEADVASAEARLNNAQRNARRTKPLYEAKAASQKDLDDAVSAEEVAAADVKSARAKLADAKRDLTYTKVEAPVAGLTSRSLKSEGTLIAGPQDLLTTVTQADPIYVNFGLSEADQAALKRDAAAGKLTLPKDGRFDVAIRFEDGHVYSRAGKLVFTDARVNNQTGTSDARAEVPNPGAEVRPGQFVRVVLKGAKRLNAMTVPQRAVQEGPQGKVVYVIGKEGKAEPRPVTLGDWTGKEWVVLSGLAPGDKVITDGLMKVMMIPGAPVQVGDPGTPAVTPSKEGAQPKAAAPQSPDAKSKK